ncbi:hypothetical protein QJS66_10590 [Kocuria rhizophila]|nr:hypothetical protein QJS66_10590 [Kocuria rhizophila]
MDEVTAPPGYAAAAAGVRRSPVPGRSRPPERTCRRAAPSRPLPPRQNPLRPAGASSRATRRGWMDRRTHGQQSPDTTTPRDERNTVMYDRHPDA